MKSRKARAEEIMVALRAAYPHSTCALDHESPFQLLIATMLSAQTTDIKVNEVTAELFARYPDAPSLASSDVDEVGRIISRIGLWRNKARNIVALSGILVGQYGGQMPTTVEELVELPGVGRKTATAVLGTAFSFPVGVTVDTHMLRINALLRLSKHHDPDKMAKELEKLIPPEEWSIYTHRIIDHGRLVCVARRPRCGICPLQTLCPSAFDVKAGYKPANDEKEPASAKGLSWMRRLH